jgi:hypothetical protein
MSIILAGLPSRTKGSIAEGSGNRANLLEVDASPQKPKSAER